MPNLALIFSGYGRTVMKRYPTVVHTRLGQLITELRQAAGLSGARLAETAKVPQSLLNRVERGERPATDDFLAKIAPVLGVSFDVLKEATYDDVIPADERRRLAGWLAKTGSLHVVPGSGQPQQTRPTNDDQLAANMQAVVPSQMRRLPMYDDVACGWGSAVPSVPGGYDEWPDWMAGDADHTIRVRGDSMADVGYEAGGIVFVKNAPDNVKKIPSGSKVIAHLGDDMYTCKVLRHDQHVIWLEGAADGWRKPRYMHEQPFKVVGIVVGYFKREA
jgi:SOS-response transcriptional repressor LexA